MNLKEKKNQNNPFNRLFGLFIILSIVTILSCAQNKKEIKYYENGNVKSEGYIKDGQANGLFRHYYENGQLKSEIPWVDGRINGTVLEYGIDGSLNSRRIFQNDKMNGQAFFYNDSAKISLMETYSEGKKMDLFEKYYSDGTVFEKGKVKNGQKHGLHEAFTDKGHLFIRQEMINGQRHGFYHLYHENTDQLKEVGNYYEGVRNGWFMHYDRNGKFLDSLLIIENDAVEKITYESTERTSRLNKNLSSNQIDSLLNLFESRSN